MQQVVPATVEQEGAVAVWAQLLDQATKKLTGQVVLEGSDAGLTIAAGATRYQLRGIDPQALERLQTPEGLTFTVPMDALRQGLQAVAFAVSRDATRPALGGVFLQAADDGILLTASDSYRLAQVKLQGITYEQGPGDAAALIPTKCIRELLKCTEYQDEEARFHVCVSDATVEFSTGNSVLTSLLIDARFPDYSRVIPESFEHVVTFQGDHFANALRRALPIAQHSVNRVVLEVTDNAICVQTAETEIGEFREEVPATLDGRPGTFAFNGQYLLEPLEALGPSQTWQFHLNGYDKAAMLRPSDLGGYIYIVMPMRVTGQQQ